MEKKILLLIILLATYCNAQKIPSEKFSQMNFPKPKLNIKNNGLNIELKNPVHCPLRVILRTNDKYTQSLFDKLNPIKLSSKIDTIIHVSVDPKKIKKNFSFNYNWYFGDPSKKIVQTKVSLPFPKGKVYKVIQGNNSNYTHNSEYSKYAIDLSLKINDTICSATNGYVVGVIDKYKYGGKGNEWNNYGNYITIYDSNSGVFTQYVHLTQNGSFVKVGDKVKQGQVIGLSGLTGQTDIEHLHFNCLIPVANNNGLKSIPIEFIEGYKGVELKRGDVIKKY